MNKVYTKLSTYVIIDLIEKNDFRIDNALDKEEGNATLRVVDLVNETFCLVTKASVIKNLENTSNIYNKYSNIPESLKSEHPVIAPLAQQEIEFYNHIVEKLTYLRAVNLASAGLPRLVEIIDNKTREKFNSDGFDTTYNKEQAEKA